MGQFVGDYEIVDELGRGGMGVVYRAYDRTLKREVAIKFLSPRLASDERVSQRFIREARATAQLSHPGIVRVYDVFQHGPQRMIAMEYVPGKTLTQIIRESGPLPVKQATRIILQAAEALAAAHEKGIIHRDIKPQNIMVCPDGRVKVLDFGLAKVRDDFVGLTTTGAYLGTPTYMSPEQCKGKQVDARTDIYSLGVTLFEMLTGAPPFDAPTPLVVMHQILTSPFPNVSKFRPEVNRSLQEILARMTSQNPADRCESAQALCEALRESIEKRPSQRLFGSWRKRVAAATFGVVLLGSIWLLARAYFQEPQAAGASQNANADSGQGLIADAYTDFSNIQGKNNWYYGYYAEPFTAATFTQMQQFKSEGNDPLEGRWSVEEGTYWTGINRTAAFPNAKVSSFGRQPIEQWPVRRWKSSVEGEISINGHIALDNDGTAGDGLTCRILVDDKILWNGAVNAGDTKGSQFSVKAQVMKGSLVDFAVIPGGNDWQDGALFAPSITFESNPTPAPVQRVIAMSDKDFSDSQGLRGWYYGYYAVENDPESFQVMKRFNPDKKFWEGDGGYGELWFDGGHPGEPAHLCVRRWISSEAGTVSISGGLAKIDTGQAGEGVTGMILVDGTEVWKGHVNKDDDKGIFYAVDANIEKGTPVDFVFECGQNNWQDGSRFTAVICRGDK